MKRIFDIETYENPKAEAYYARKEYKAPGNYKDPAKIAAYVEEARAKDRKNAALHWWTGLVTCVGVGDLNKNVRTFSFAGIVNRQVVDPIEVLSVEKTLLVDLFKHLEENPGVELIGKRSRDFDIPYLIGRAMAHDIGIPLALRQHEPNKLLDIEHIFSTSRSCGQVCSLNDMAWGLGIDAKLGKGTDALDWFREGLYDKIDTYCAGDVRITAEVFKRYNKVFTGGCVDDRPLFPDD